MTAAYHQFEGIIIAAQVSVSYTPVRETITKLTLEGMVIHDGRSAHVARNLGQLTRPPRRELFAQ